MWMWTTRCGTSIHPHWPARFGGGLSGDDAVREVVDYMLAVQRERPAVGFFIIVNLPLWGWKGQPSYVGNEFLGDYHPLVEKLIALAHEKQAPLRGWTVDFPRDYRDRYAGVPIGSPARRGIQRGGLAGTHSRVGTVGENERSSNSTSSSTTVRAVIQRVKPDNKP